MTTTASVTSRRVADRRAGFTLLELLVVVGILVVLMGLAVPMVASSLDRRRLASVAEEVIGSMLMARAHAQAEGVTVEIVLAQPQEGPRAERGSQRLLAREIDLHAPPYEDEDGPAPLMRAWADVAIDWPLRVRVVPPDDEFQDDAVDPRLRSLNRADVATRDGSSRAAGGARGSRSGVWSTNRETDARERIAVFAADGSALVAPRVRVYAPDGRFLDILVNPFTGLPRLESTTPGIDLTRAGDDLNGFENRGDWETNP